MWSHTIQTTKPKAPTTTSEKPAKPSGPTTKESRKNATKVEDITQGFEVDDFSKTSRVHASKKPLTVAKAPTFGRTTSTQAEKEPATPKDDARPTLEKKASRAPPSSAVKAITPVRRNGTPAERPSTAARAKASLLASRARTPTQAAVKSRAGTPVQGRASVKSPKATANGKGRANTEKPLPDARIIEPENERDLDSKIHNDTESAAATVAGADVNILSPVVQEKKLPSTPRKSHGIGASIDFNGIGEGLGSLSRRKDMKLEGTEMEAHENLNREITLRNDTIKSLRRELQMSQTTHEQELNDSESKAAVHIRSLRSELDSIRSTLVDLDDTHRSTLEKHDSLLRSRDKIVQNLSQEVDGLRGKHEATDQVKEKSVKDLEQELQPTEDSEKPDSNLTLLRSKNEEIQSLSEMVQDLRNQLEAVDTAKAKEIYDELLRSKDEKLRSASEAVQDLQGELRATTKDQDHEQFIQVKNEEIESLRTIIQETRERLEATEKIREQEVNHSVSSLRGEFQDLQNKHKRKIEELNTAAAARIETLQAEYDELLRSREEEIKVMTSVNQDLQREIETIRDAQKQELDDANTSFKEQLRGIEVQHEVNLREAYDKSRKDLKAIRAEQQASDSSYASETKNLARDRDYELDKVKAEKQTAYTDHQQELREMRKMHERTLESARNDAQRELRDEISRLERELEEVSTSRDQKVQDIEARHREEIQQNANCHDQALDDRDFQHERDLERANVKYQQELADVERLRGQGSEDLSQKHEDQLKIIAEKYQQQLEEAAQQQKDMLSRHENVLQEARSQCQESQNQAASSQWELEKVVESSSKLKGEKHDLEKRLLESAAEHEKELEYITEKHRGDSNQAIARNDEVTRLLEQQKQAHHEQITVLELELDKLSGEFATAVAEAASLKVTFQELEVSQRKAVEEASLAQQQKIRDTALKHEQDLAHLRTNFEAAEAETAVLKRTLEDAEAARHKVNEDVTLEHERTLRDETSKRDQEMAHLSQEYDNVVEQMATLQAELQDLGRMGNDAAEERAKLRGVLEETELAKHEMSLEIAVLIEKLELASGEITQNEETTTALKTDIDELVCQMDALKSGNDREAHEAAVEITLQKDKLELADREICQQKHAIAALQTQGEELRGQLTDSDEDLNRERNETAVEIALLKDRLELAELQKQSASEDVSLSRNEANVEIALLKDRLELSDMQSRQDKETIATLEKRLRELQAKPPDRDPFIHHQLREELAMLARHHAANLADVEALKASVLADREVREEEWRQRTEGGGRIMKEIQGIGAELNGIVEAH